jgi:hypothetical protein
MCCHWWTIRSRTPACLVAHRTIRCHTPDSPVQQGTVAQRLVPGSTRERSHQTLRCDTRLSGVKACSTNGHMLCQIQRLGAPEGGTRFSGAYLCAAESSNFSPTTIIVLWPIYTSPNRPFEGVGAKQHTKTYYRHFQVLKHRSA